MFCNRALNTEGIDERADWADTFNLSSYCEYCDKARQFTSSFE